MLFNEESAVVDPTTSTIISEESGKTVFGNWVQTKPGETSTVAFTYELPFEISTDAGLLQTVKNKVGLNNGETYSLLVQKQSGISELPGKITVISKNGEKKSYDVKLKNEWKLSEGK